MKNLPISFSLPNLMQVVSISLILSVFRTIMAIPVHSLTPFRDQRSGLAYRGSRSTAVPGLSLISVILSCLLAPGVSPEWLKWTSHIFSGCLGHLFIRLEVGAGTKRLPDNRSSPMTPVGLVSCISILQSFPHFHQVSLWTNFQQISNVFLTPSIGWVGR